MNYTNDEGGTSCIQAGVRTLFAKSLEKTAHVNTQIRWLCYACAHAFQIIPKHTSKPGRTDSRWLLKRNDRKTERRRRDTLSAIKDAE